MKRYTMLLALFGAMIFCSAALADSGVGQVISIRPGAFADRGANSVTLALKARVNERDILRTDASGRMQVILDDDTAIALAPSTRINLERVVVSGKPEFRATMTGGLARFITGKIVERNPGAFTVNTAKGSVGISGTIFSIRDDKNSTTVYVTSTTHGGVDVGGVLVPPGSKITLADGMAPVVLPMTREESESIEQQVATGIASGNIVATGEATTTEGEKESVFQQADTSPLTSPTDLRDSLNDAKTITETFQPLQTGLAMYAGMEGNITGALSINSVADSGLYSNLPLTMNLDLFSGQGAGQVAITATSGGNPMNMTNDIYLWTYAYTMNLTGSVNSGTLNISGSAPGAGVLWAVDYEPTPPAERAYPYNSLGSFNLSGTATIMGDSKTIIVKDGSGSYGYTFHPGDTYTGPQLPGIQALIDSGATVTAPVDKIEGSASVTPKP